MPCCLFYCHLAFQRDPKPFKRSGTLFEFPLIRVKATCILDSEVTLLEAKKKHLKHASCPNSFTES